MGSNEMAVASFLLVVVGAAIVSEVARRRGNRRMRTRFESLGLEDGNEGRGEHQGVAYRLRFRPREWGRAALAVAIRCGAEDRTRISRESWSDRLAGMGLSFAPILAAGIELTLNSQLDVAKVSKHDTVIAKQRQSQTQAGVEYRVLVESWRHGRRFESLPISRDDFHRIAPGSTRIRVRTKPGWLGYEWMTGYELLQGGASEIAPVPSPHSSS